MSAQLKPKPAAPIDIQELHTEQTEIELLLIGAERSVNEARTAHANAVAERDAEAIKDAREEIGRSEGRAAEVRLDLAAVKAKVEEAQNVARIQAQGNRMTVLVKLAADMVKGCEAVEEAALKWAVARKSAVAAATEFETELARNNVTFDAFLSVATRMDARIELIFWLETDGAYGRCRSLDTPTQLRESGRASLVTAAKDFRTLTLRQARGTLGIPETH